MGRPGVSKVPSPGDATSCKWGRTGESKEGTSRESGITTCRSELSASRTKGSAEQEKTRGLEKPPAKTKIPHSEAGSASDRKLVDPIGSSSEEEVSERSSSKSREKKKSPSRSPLVRRPHGAKQRKKFARGEYGDRVSFKTPIATVVNDEKKDTATPGQQQAPKGKKGQGKERQKGKGKGFQKGGGKQKGKEKSAKKGGKRKGQKKGKGAWGAGEPRRSGETW